MLKGFLRKKRTTQPLTDKRLDHEELALLCRLFFPAHRIDLDNWVLDVQGTMLLIPFAPYPKLGDVVADLLRWRSRLED